MAAILISFLLIVLILVGFTLWGVFTSRTSWWCAVAALPVLLFAGVGALHAWGESRDVGWTVFYGMGMVVALVSMGRQVSLAVAGSRRDARS